MDKIKILELFSGIGGLRYSVLQSVSNSFLKKEDQTDNEFISVKSKESDIIDEIKKNLHFVSFDINPFANETYYHNFQTDTIYLKNRREINHFLRKGKTKENNTQEGCFQLNNNYILQSDIRNITLQFLEQFCFDILLMSNPCQPYTRQNKKSDTYDWTEFKRLYEMIMTYNGEETQHIISTHNRWNEEKEKQLLHVGKDERTNAFIHICDLLREGDIHKLPTYIFIENVKNFELSSSFLYFLFCIKGKYQFQTYLLSPLQFGFPNERLRFYCICRKKEINAQSINPSFFNALRLEQTYDNNLIPNTTFCKKGKTPEDRKENTNVFFIPNLTTFLDEHDEFPLNQFSNSQHLYNPMLKEFKIDTAILQKKSAYCFDIIDVYKIQTKCCVPSNELYCFNSHSQRMKDTNDHMPKKKESNQIHTTCFTSNYTRYIRGTGSILYFKNPEEKVGFYETNRKEYQVEEMKKYENKVRYLSPTEICRFMGFKMRTILNEGTENNKEKTNRIGNIFWNINHINHVCAYKSDVHYCYGNNGNGCIMKEEELAWTPKLKDKKENHHKCVCTEFTFPKSITKKQQYNLIGNSVNVTLISLLLNAHEVIESTIKKKIRNNTTVP